MTSFRKVSVSREDLEKVEEEIFHEFHVFYVRFTNEVNIIAGLQQEIIRRLAQIQNRLDRMLVKKDRQHLENHLPI